LGIRWRNHTGPPPQEATTIKLRANSKYPLDGTNPGADPWGGLIADANGDLFGTTTGGGTNGDGAVFELVNIGNGSYTQQTLVSFTGDDGANPGSDPRASLIADAKGDLFGTTDGGGANGYGTVFELVNNGNDSYTLQTLVSFTGDDGTNPTGSLIADANGDLFGTTSGGGTNGYGTVFEITGSGFIVALPTVEPDRAHVQLDHTLSVNAANGVLANDIDPIPNDTLSVSAVDGLASNVGHALAGSYGTLTLNANGSYSYSANHGGLPLLGVGIDTFSYTAAEGVGGTATSTLTVVVTQPWQTYVGGTTGTTIKGGFGFYVLDGGAGNDALVAGVGIQVLIGGPNDTLTAALGVDTFVFAPGFGMNTITKFNPILDSIELPKSEFANFAAVHMQQVGENTVITYDAADVITLTGAHTPSLHASDFQFV
jgi:uncharacterized repeat protein (TIGR03803 family)/VCBS repeat-containing protein